MYKTLVSIPELYKIVMVVYSYNPSTKDIEAETRSFLSNDLEVSLLHVIISKKNTQIFFGVKGWGLDRASLCSPSVLEFTL